jgi:hypothetical protein
MRKLLCAVVLFLLGSLAAVAQDFPKAEVFGGVSAHPAGQHDPERLERRPYGKL